MAIRTYGPLPITIIAASNEGGPNYHYDCDLVSQRPDPTKTKDGDLAWTRDERKLYVNDTNVWVQLYPLAGASGVGVTAYAAVTQTATEYVITHDQNNASAVVTWSLDWNTQSWEDRASRTTNSVKIKFTTAAPASAHIGYRVT